MSTTIETLSGVSYCIRVGKNHHEHKDPYEHSLFLVPRDVGYELIGLDKHPTKGFADQLKDAIAKLGIKEVFFMRRVDWTFD